MIMIMIIKINVFIFHKIKTTYLMSHFENMTANREIKK